ncbi:hypothetical protein [Desulfosporosinus sp. OT]|uniref:hypothetical protein n=1 Tax=Desulfosporosinus sp. OT TaxID=913865 RepID=UPI000223A896|nr:hypothetical protein [Desulfosporosinus sp. OT]EGW40539.1 hypothetical protein DOT_1539 [Desulfosporosinus sp. OT]
MRPEGLSTTLNPFINAKLNKFADAELGPYLSLKIIFKNSNLNCVAIIRVTKD